MLVKFRIRYEFSENPIDDSVILPGENQYTNDSAYDRVAQYLLEKKKSYLWFSVTQIGSVLPEFKGDYPELSEKEKIANLLHAVGLNAKDDLNEFRKAMQMIKEDRQLGMAGFNAKEAGKLLRDAILQFGPYFLEDEEE